LYFTNLKSKKKSKLVDKKKRFYHKKSGIVWKDDKGDLREFDERKRKEIKVKNKKSFCDVLTIF